MRQVDQDPGSSPSELRRGRGRPKGSKNPAAKRKDRVEAPAPSGYLKPEAAGAHVGVTAGALAKWRHAGTGPAYIRVGGRILYKATDLDAYLEARRVNPSTAA